MTAQTCSADATTVEGAAPVELRVYRASHESIEDGLYTTQEAARAHCEAYVRREEPEGTIAHLSWWTEETGDDAVYYLAITPTKAGAFINETGYRVTPLTVQAAYDPKAADPQREVMRRIIARRASRATSMSRHGGAAE